MTRANSEQQKHTPWFAKAGAACSIVPIGRFVGQEIFALKGGGYGCLFALTGLDEEGLTDAELEVRVRSLEGALHGQPNQKHVWFVIDELASLQRLPQLHTAITENRKSANPIVLGFQGKSQLEVIYGRLAEVMLSQPATKIFMKTAEPNAAKWISDAIGEVEIERVKETKFDGSRSGKNFTLDRQTEQLVLKSEISGLDDRHAYLKLGNNIARFAFDYMDLPKTTRAFIPRESAEDELRFDPRTMKPVEPRIPSPAAPVGAAPPPLPKEVATAGARARPVLVQVAEPEQEETPREPAAAERIESEETAVQLEADPEEDHHAQIDNTVIAEGYVSNGHHF